MTKNRDVGQDGMILKTEKQRQFVFTYGSLVDPQEIKSQLGKPSIEGLCYETVTIYGYKRTWGVAMDNSIKIPGYKYYVDANGTRPSVYVCFLDIEQDVNSCVNGIIFEVDERELTVLDEREKNYLRTDISTSINTASDGKVWAYKGLPDAKKRFEIGVDSNRAVIHQDYLEKVLTAFKSISYEYLIEFIKNTEFPEVQIIPLNRLEIDH